LIFWAPWCGPCLVMAPVLDDLSEELEGKIKIGKIDTEVPENQALANKISNSEYTKYETF